MPPASSTPQISALFKGPNGQNPDLTDLSPEHEIHLIDEAREHYTSDPPVFVIDNKNKQKSTVSKACLALEGHTGTPGTKISVTVRAWCSQNKYQTIDLNKQRIIVKYFRGGPRGGFYRRWMGVIAGFEKQPIAFAVSKARESNEMGRASLPGGMRGQDLVTSDAKSATVRKRKSMPSRVKVNESDSSETEFVPPRKRTAHASSLRQKRLIELEKSTNATRNRSPQIDQPLDLAPAATMNPPKSKPASTRASVASSTAALHVRVKKEPGTYEMRIRLPAPSKTPVQPANTSSVQSQAQSSNNNVSSRLAPPSCDDNSSREIPQSNLPSATPSSSKAAATSAPPNSNDEYEELVSNFLSSPLLATATTTTTTTTTNATTTKATATNATTNNATITNATTTTTANATTLSQPEAASSLAPILSPKKQAATILSVYLNRDEDYVPLYLRSCMTISNFFASCLGAFELVDQPETVSALRVRLDHSTTTTTTRPVANDVETRQEIGWLVKRAVPDSFDIFLETVNKWAGWKDRDTCDVRVDIILKAKK